ncbi:MAG: hypothetical protein J2P51_06790 [Hyphomicrobiaceae bacterium]|nr:hypothetical protein [Hyphomicrobiaceae bacterium]
MPSLPAYGALLGLTIFAGPSGLAMAQHQAMPVPSAPESEEEAKERRSRHQCALALCATLHNHTPDAGEVSCSLQKTWRKEVLTKILERGKVAWPWGYARCMGEVIFDRATLVKSMTLPQFEAHFQKHDIRCELEAQTATYEVKLQIQPKVTFRQGKAVKASLNWGKIEAPKLAKTALWSATAADNSLGVLQSIVVDDINEFIHTRCMESKEEWQGK